MLLMDGSKGRLVFFLAFCVLLGLFLARLFSDGTPAAEAPAPAMSVAKAPPATPAKPAAKKAEPAPAPRKSKKIASRAKPQPDDDSIPFRVENGMAIAFGDIMLGTPDDPEIKEGFTDVAPPQLWDRPEIPYAIHPDLSAPKRVEQAVEYFNRNTPVRLVPYTGQPDVVVFEPTDEHCYSLLGRAGGAQPIRIAKNCTWHEIAHELMHALGFVHEQSRRDRDQYVQVLWDNIEPKFKDQFAVVPDSFLSAVRGTPFDYNSIMLYRPDMFQRNPGLPTMRSLGQTPISPVAEGLSEGDIERLRRLYH